VAQRVLPGRLAHAREQPWPEQQPGPAAEDDPLRVEQVDQAADAGAEVPPGLIDDGGRGGGAGRGLDQLRQRQFLVARRQRAAAPVQDRGRAGVGLQAARRPAAALAAPGGDGDVPELGRA
jgi:hypothetical protein